VLHVEGTASVFEATLQLEVVAHGQTLSRRVVMASEGAPGRGRYVADLPVPTLSQPIDATLRAFSASPKDGSVQNLVEVPLRLLPSGAPAGQRAVLVYFVRLANGVPEYVPVQREVGPTLAVGASALQALLAGPTAEEQARGLTTPIPPGARLRSLAIVDGTATADFNRQIEAQDETQQVRALRRCIELTLLQFPTVQRVVIAVEGQTTGVLEVTGP